MTEVLQFPVRKGKADERFYHQFPRVPRRVSEKSSVPVQGDVTTQPQRRLIQGKVASDLEWRVYQALLRAGYDEAQIQFQVGFMGGRNFRGGVIVDFLVGTVPVPTIVEVNGEYWHEGKFEAEDHTQRLGLIQELGDSVQIVDLWQNQLMSDDMAYDAVVMNVGMA